ncbi:hypothetical protein LOTGIDRAFT_215760 [Lottia gigantea]|uniref:Succinate dehydrogenase assembly factor 3 n=1 Tax=Lottia gigantea TaxID=225164 RepID=V4ABR9_LOTGI|nr:hypothetical protein LOTGIDRAFT_215760 [Lottia gigantea]ESO94262.1 hypothetical protein LOTGIDRAFT_215760 [Lottia gigantea]
MSGVTQVLKVRALYKAILKIHRGLPLEMKALGDQYVKEEFRQHQNASSAEADIFMQEWTKYYMTLAKQIGRRRANVTVGQNLSSELLNCFNEEQIGQLNELLQETQKPRADPFSVDDKS